MIVSGLLIGDRSLIDRLDRMPVAGKRRIDATVMALGFMLEGYVKANKLTGQVLRVQTGRLRASISQATAQQAGDSRSGFASTPTSAIYTVGTNVSYGAIWEKYGSRAHEVVAKKGSALKFEIGGTTFFRRRVNIPAQPARPYLEPALQEKKPEIIDRLRKTLHDVAQETLRP